MPAPSRLFRAVLSLPLALPLLPPIAASAQDAALRNPDAVMRELGGTQSAKRHAQTGCELATSVQDYVDDKVAEIETGNLSGSATLQMNGYYALARGLAACYISDAEGGSAPGDTTGNYAMHVGQALVRGLTKEAGAFGPVSHEDPNAQAAYSLLTQGSWAPSAGDAVAMLEAAAPRPVQRANMATKAATPVSEVLNAHESNMLRFERDYVGKTVKVSGVVTGVFSESTLVFVHISTPGNPNTWAKANCEMSAESPSVDVVAELSEGDKVVGTGVVTIGDFDIQPGFTLQDCAVVKG